MIHPHQFAAKLQIAPYVYFIKPWEVSHRFTDAIYDTVYLGGTAVMLVNVPHGLTEDDLRAWFRAGLVGGDVEVIEITKKIQRAERKLNSLRGNLRQMEQQLEDAGALRDDDTSVSGGGSASTVSAAVVHARKADSGTNYGGAVVTGGGLALASAREPGSSGGGVARGARQGPDVSGLQEGVDRLRSMVQEWGGRTLPSLLEARSELLDTAAAMDVRLLRVAEQSEWEAMAVARWSGADVTNQERRQRLRFGVALAAGESGVASKARTKRGRKRERAKAKEAAKGGQGKFRAKVVGASGVPPTDEEADDEVEERLRSDPSFVGSVRRDGKGASSFGGTSRAGPMTADGFTTGRTGTGHFGNRRPSSAGSGGSIYISGGGDDEDQGGDFDHSSAGDSSSDGGDSSGDDISDDDARTGVSGAGRTAGNGSTVSRASSRAARRRVAREMAEAADQDRRGVKRRHVWQLFLPSG